MERPFQAYEGDEPYVFACYSHEDRARVYPELVRLREAGFNLWYDEGISPGSEWSDALARHIESCAVFLYFVTPRSVVSEHCRREVNFALEQPCGLLSVHLERTELPSGLKLTLSNRQAILKYDEPTTVYEAKVAQAIGDAARHDVEETPTSTVRLGDWTLDVGTQRLARGEESHVLDPKALSVVLHLIDRAPEVVSRQGLIERTWPDVVVGDNVLDQAIAQLRRVLGDDAREPKYIETLPRRGYRLIAPLAVPDQAMADGLSVASQAGARTQHRGARSPVGWAIAAGLVVAIAAALSLWLLKLPVPAGDAAETPRESRPLDRSVAVLPFSVPGNEPTTATYASMFTEELRAVVTGYQELRSVSVPDEADSNAIGRASYVVAGTVQHFGERVRLGANLTRTDDRHTIWAKYFEPVAMDELGDPAELTATVGRFVRLQLVLDQQCESVRRTSPSAEAADAYCAALAEYHRFEQVGDFDLSLMLSRAQRALALDPGIADACRLVASGYSLLGSLGAMDWRDASLEAHAALDRGLSIAPDDTNLLGARGSAYSLELDYPAAEASYRASLASDPLHPNAYTNHMGLAELALARGDLNEALKQDRRALRIYDSHAGLYAAYAGHLWFAGQNREALEVLNAGLRLVQSGAARFYLLVVEALAHDALNETAEANAALDEALDSVGPAMRLQLAGPLARVGRTDEARELLGELEALDDPPVEPMVHVYAELEPDRAFDWIHIAIDRHIGGVVPLLRTSPVYSELRTDFRWKEVMAHLESEEATGRAHDRG